MPPSDYTPYRRVVPNSGIATNIPDPALDDPTIQAYLAEQRAAREPWSSYISRTAKDIGNNAYNVGSTLLTEGIRPSALVQGAVETGGKAIDLMSGRIPLYDPRTGQVNPKAVETSFDLGGTVTLGAGAIPAEANALRTGATIATKAPEPMDVPHPNNPEGSTRLAEVRGGFYNKSENALLKYKKPEATIKEYFKFLKDSGVKPREIEALFGGRSPDEVVKRADLLEQAKANEPRFKDMPTQEFDGDDYNMPGGSNYRMLNLTLENPGEPYSKVPFQFDSHRLPPNTVVHLALKDDAYKAADGTERKVLRVEELQSDWAQQYRGKWKLPASADRIEHKVVETGTPEFRDLFAQHIFQTPYDKLTELERDTLDIDMHDWEKDGTKKVTFYRVPSVPRNKWQLLPAETDPEFLLKEARDTYGQLLQEDKLDARGKSAIPRPSSPVEQMLFNEKYGFDPAPFAVQGSAGVVPLALKRALIEAARNGQDEIVFAPGSVHANRWPNSKDVKGLASFYDDLLPRETSKLLKDIEKDSGIKGLTADVENRPFLKDTKQSKGRTAETNLGVWTTKVRGDELAMQDAGFPTKPVMQPTDGAMGAMEKLKIIAQNADAHDAWKKQVDDIDTELREISLEMANPFGQGTMSLEDAAVNRVVLYDERIKLNTQLMEREQKKIDQLSAKPPEELTEGDIERIEDLKKDRDDYANRVQEHIEKRAALKYAFKIAKHWDINVKKPPPELKGMVIKLTPELRDYINKNGLPRFKKGGIVDLAELAAKHGGIHI